MPRRKEGDMKRIANNVALATVLYVIGGTQKIRIYDGRDAWHTGELVFDGLLKDSAGRLCRKHEAAAIHRISIDGDTMVFDLDTSYELF